MIFIAAGLALAATLPAVPASAQVARTFVSAGGNDSNNCANVATPCRHFQTAVTATAPGGEVVALDPANYGSITISQAITIDGQGWSYIAPPNNGNAITINAGSGSVTIRRVLLDGDGATGGTNGIVFMAGGSLTVTDCVAQNFSFTGPITTGNGILIQPSSGAIKFAITNTNASNNGYTGVYYLPQSGSATANGVIDHVVTANNQYGMAINSTVGGGSGTVAISSTIVSNNSVTGIYVANIAPLTISIDNTGVAGNGNGIVAFDTANVTLGRSVITANGNGINNATAPNTFYSYQDNRINGNATDIIGTALNSHALQ
jgi:hypothetical protein